MESLLSSVPDINAAWLKPPATVPCKPTRAYEIAHIKQLRTSAPKDMKATKERRTTVRTRAAKQARERRKQNNIPVQKKLKFCTRTEAQPESGASGDQSTI